jgi:hypothetical protein
MLMSKETCESNQSTFNSRDVAVFIYVIVYFFACLFFWGYCIYSFFHSLFFNWDGWVNTISSLLCVIFIPFGSFVLLFMFIILINKSGFNTQFKISRFHFNLTIPKQDEDKSGDENNSSVRLSDNCSRRSSCPER